MIEQRISTHDHVGSMTYRSDGSAECRVCGQIWHYADRRLVALPYDGSLPSRIVRIVDRSLTRRTHPLE